MALDTAGVRSASQDALACVGPWGTVCLVGVGSEVLVSLAKMLRSQIRVMTSWTMSIQAQKACADFILARNITIDALFTDRWALDQAVEAYRAFDMQSGGKGVFQFD